MSSLYKRASPSQRRILRAVEGAVKNAGDAHPEWKFDDYIARSIAKRAAGTLTAQWPEVLAAKGSSPSDQAGVSLSKRDQPAGSQVAKGSRVRLGLSSRTRGASHPARRSPLRFLWKQVSIMIGQAKREGRTEAAEALVEVAKRIGCLSAEEHSWA